MIRRQMQVILLPHHGTKVASVAAAEMNNGSSTIGIAPEGVEIVALKITGDVDLVDPNNGINYNTGSWIQAVNFAENNNIDILNISLGNEHNPASCDDYIFTNNSTTTDYLEYEVLRDYPGFVAIAAPNEPREYANKNNWIRWPADFATDVTFGSNATTTCWSGLDNVMAVGGTQLNKTTGSGAGTEEIRDRYSYRRDKWGGSAYGDHIDITAPSAEIPTAVNIASGNSYAAPQVAGVAALMLRVNPNLSPTTTKALIRASADDVGSSLSSTTLRTGSSLTSLQNPTIVSGVNPG